MRIRFGRSRESIENYSKRLEERIHELIKESHRKKEELRMLQSQLIQAAKMTAIGELSAGVAHELNNPLGGILGYAQFALEKLSRAGKSETDFAAMKRYIEHIEKEASRCKAIVENLLVFARRSNEMKQIDIREVLNDALAIMKHQLALANIDIRLDLPKGSVKMNGNTTQLQQVFINIIVNAAQAMPEGGSLIISLNETAGEIAVTFKDTGCGIPKENLDKIFDPFFTTKQDWKGTGLGLTVSQQIIKEHKGAIRVDSEPNKGATFTITLPKGKEE